MGEKFQFAVFLLCRSFHIEFWVKTDLRRARSFYLVGWLMSVSDVSHLCWGSRLRDTKVLRGGRFFFSSNFGDVKIAAGESHKPMKQMIMHEPLTQWKWVWIPDTWLVVVSVLLIFSFGMYDSRRRSHGNTVVVPCQWFITLYMLPVSSESVDWTDRKSQEYGGAQRNQSCPSWLRGIKLLLSLVSNTLRVSRVG